MRVHRDDLGNDVALPARVRRVASLVPSLTEAVAATRADVLVAATDWCTHPSDLDVVRVGGTKNPDVERLRALRPDVVVANEEENRRADLDALRAAGLAVWVTSVRTVEEAWSSLGRMLAAVDADPEPGWLAEARRAWDLPERPRRRRGVIPIWRRPWMVLGADTFAGDVLARLGVDNVYARHAERYPKVPLPELLAVRADLVVMPDEPYRFAPDDGPECFPGLPVALVSGRHLTWYGPSLAEAVGVLDRQLAAATTRPHNM